MRTTNIQIGLMKSYNYVKNYVVQSGFEDEIKWQKNLQFENLTEPDFLRESAWVILTTGMKESIIRKYFDDISFCFFEWESANKIVESKRLCFEAAINLFNNPRKISAIISVSDRVANLSFKKLKIILQESPLETLRTFSFIGPVTCYHLAKNLGIPVAKADRHLSRLSKSMGYSDVQNFCGTISKISGDPVPVVDIVLWRFATLKQDYLNMFLNYAK